MWAPWRRDPPKQARERILEAPRTRAPTRGALLRSGTVLAFQLPALAFLIHQARPMAEKAAPSHACAQLGPLPQRPLICQAHSPQKGTTHLARRLAELPRQTSPPDARNCLPDLCPCRKAGQRVSFLTQFLFSEASSVECCSGQ